MGERTAFNILYLENTKKTLNPLNKPSFHHPPPARRCAPAGRGRTGRGRTGRGVAAVRRPLAAVCGAARRAAGGRASPRWRRWR